MLRRPLLAAAAIVLAATAAGAQPQRQPSMEDLLRLQEDLRGRELQREEMAVEAETARAQIAELNAQLADLSLNEAQGQLTVNDKRLRLADMSVRETELSVRVGANRNRLSHLLGALQLYSRNPPPALFVHPEDAKKAVRAAILIRAVTPELERRAKLYAGEVDEALRLRRQLAAGSAELFTAESALAEQKSRLEQMLVERTALERQLSSSVLIAEREIAALSTRAQTLSRLLGALPANGPVTMKAGGRPSTLRAPVVGPVVARFGEKREGAPASPGWTWLPAGGASVLAPASGLVEFAGPLYGWGQVLILRTGGNYHLVLAGMDSITVKPGQSVADGQSVGRMAIKNDGGVGSGLAELYLEVRNGNRPVDPAQFLR